jgi:hypothetical protein
MALAAISAPKFQGRRSESIAAGGVLQFVDLDMAGNRRLLNVPLPLLVEAGHAPFVAIAVLV